jgi:hypothetical protein
VCVVGVSQVKPVMHLTKDCDAFNYTKLQGLCEVKHVIHLTKSRDAAT